MIDVTVTLVGILVFFLIILGFRSVRSLKVCALCGAVSLTWLVLLCLLYVGYEVDPVLIGILMGGSGVGLVYLLEQKLPEHYQIVKTPFYLSFVVLAYALLGGSIGITTGAMLIVIWIVFLVVYFARHTKKLSEIAKRVIACCKNW